MSRINWRGALRPGANAEQETVKDCVEVSVYWHGTCLQQDQFDVKRDKPFYYRVGETPQCRFMVDREFIRVSDYSLLEIAGDDVTVNIPAFCQGTVQQGDVSDSFAGSEQIRPYGLALHGQLLCELGPWTFKFKRIVEDHPATFGMGLSFMPNRWTYISVAAHAVFFMLIGMVPPEAAGMNFDDTMTNNRFAKYMIPVAAQRDVETVSITPDEPAGGNTGKAQAGPEGKAGDQKAKPGKGRLAIAGPMNTKRPTIGKEDVKHRASTAGILSYLQQPAIVSPFGENHTIGRDPENVLGNLIGDSPASAFGYGGFAINGSGRGGGGDGRGTLGVGNTSSPFGFSMSGTCVGSTCRGEAGAGGGVGMPKLSGRVQRHVTVGRGPDTIAGSLSKEVIRRHIRQKIAQIRFCYEKALASNETLSGRVQVMFMINGSGAVTSAVVKDSTLGNREAEQCIAGVVRRITFPSPEDRGTVIVTYPFNLVSSSQ